MDINNRPRVDPTCPYGWQWSASAVPQQEVSESGRQPPRQSSTLPATSDTQTHASSCCAIPVGVHRQNLPTLKKQPETPNWKTAFSTEINFLYSPSFLFFSSFAHLHLENFDDVGQPTEKAASLWTRQNSMKSCRCVMCISLPFWSYLVWSSGL